ncbi:unnamed protein product [Amoebophrya sp. A120]|nr:unnamed protein product [Amoebophrya sp. A120]|eukprot:GSA120T00020991001.1
MTKAKLERSGEKSASVQPLLRLAGTAAVLLVTDTASFISRAGPCSLLFAEVAAAGAVSNTTAKINAGSSTSATMSSKTPEVDAPSSAGTAETGAEWRRQLTSNSTSGSSAPAANSNSNSASSTGGGQTAATTTAPAVGTKSTGSAGGGTTSSPGQTQWQSTIVTTTTPTVTTTPAPPTSYPHPCDVQCTDYDTLSGVPTSVTNYLRYHGAPGEEVVVFPVKEEKSLALSGYETEWQCFAKTTQADTKAIAVWKTYKLASQGATQRSRCVRKLNGFADNNWCQPDVTVMQRVYMGTAGAYEPTAISMTGTTGATAANARICDIVGALNCQAGNTLPSSLSGKKVWRYYEKSVFALTSGDLSYKRPWQASSVSFQNLDLYGFHFPTEAMRKAVIADARAKLGTDQTDASNAQLSADAQQQARARRSLAMAPLLWKEQDILGPCDMNWVHQMAFPSGTADFRGEIEVDSQVIENASLERLRQQFPTTVGIDLPASEYQGSGYLTHYMNIAYRIRYAPFTSADGKDPGKFLDRAYFPAGATGAALGQRSYLDSLFTVKLSDLQQATINGASYSTLTGQYGLVQTYLPGWLAHAVAQDGGQSVLAVRKTDKRVFLYEKDTRQVTDLKTLIGTERVEVYPDGMNVIDPAAGWTAFRAGTNYNVPFLTCAAWFTCVSKASVAAGAPALIYISVDLGALIPSKMESRTERAMKFNFPVNDIQSLCQDGKFYWDPQLSNGKMGGDAAEMAPEVAAEPPKPPPAISTSAPKAAAGGAGPGASSTNTGTSSGSSSSGGGGSPTAQGASGGGGGGGAGGTSTSNTNTNTGAPGGATQEAGASTTPGRATTPTPSTSTPSPTTTLPPVTLDASYTATESLPASATAEQLLSSPGYVSAKKMGLAQGIQVPPESIEVTGFVLSVVPSSSASRRARLLSTSGATTTDKRVETKFRVTFEADLQKQVIQATATTPAGLAAASAPTAADVQAAFQARMTKPQVTQAIQTQTNTALQLTDFTADPVIDTAPTVQTVVPDVQGVSVLPTTTVPPPSTTSTTTAEDDDDSGLEMLAFILAGVVAVAFTFSAAVYCRPANKIRRQLAGEQDGATGSKPTSGQGFDKPNGRQSLIKLKREEGVEYEEKAAALQQEIIDVPAEEQEHLQVLDEVSPGDVVAAIEDDAGEKRKSRKSKKRRSSRSSPLDESTVLAEDAQDAAAAEDVTGEGGGEITTVLVDDAPAEVADVGEKQDDSAAQTTTPSFTFNY